jgi:beta-mannanase
MSSKPHQILFRVSLGAILLMTTLFTTSISPVAARAENSEQTTPILLGSFTAAIIDANYINTLAKPMDEWIHPDAHSNSMLGLSIDFEDSSEAISDQLGIIWNAGYAPLIYLTAGQVSSKPTAYQIAAGQFDTYIDQWANTFKSWAGSDKFAIISPLPEMNAGSYNGDPGNYKLAFSHIRDRFNSLGVPTNAVRWLFSINGNSTVAFEPYYPGNQWVDIVGLGAYNTGYCKFDPDANLTWDSPEDVYGPFIARINKLTETSIGSGQTQIKPIFITRLATTNLVGPNQTDEAAKNQWLQDAFAYLKGQLGVRGILVMNKDLSWECDWAVYTPNSPDKQYAGYRSAVQDTAFGYVVPTTLENTILDVTVHKAYLPLINKYTYVASNGSLPLLLGVYPTGWPATSSTYTGELTPMDNWISGTTGGRAITLLGYFDYFSNNGDGFVANVLNMIWDHGYIPFVNVYFPSGVTVASVANGNHDNDITNWALSYKKFATNGNRFAFILPFPEMNGDWVSFGGDPTNFKIAYARIRTIFKNQGVPDQSISWVFGPNGWSDPKDPLFEDYYPGDALVDVVAISAYNFGSCKSGATWEDPVTVYNNPNLGKYGYYLDRLRAMAPTKPIFIAQTGSSNQYKGAINNARKDAWLKDAYTYLKDQPNLMGVVYFGYSDSCNFAFFGSGYEFSSLQSVINQAPYGYSAPVEVMAYPDFFANTN